MRRSRRPATLALWLALAGALASPSARSAAADSEETERRLKAVGIDDALRARIHAAIDRGVSFLIAQQSADGSFQASEMPGSYHEGYTAACGLALRHAGTKEARDGAARAIHWLFDARKDRRGPVFNFVYTAGLASLLLSADESHDADLAELGRCLLQGLDPRTGWWGYWNHAAPYRSVAAESDPIQLSTTQFGCLGLWAASRRGTAKVPRSAWARHARGLCDTQAADGAWSYAPRAAPTGYGTGTFMGLASLCVCEGALGDLTDDLDLARRVLAARVRALAALDRDGGRVLASLGAGGVSWAFEGEHWSYYGLYALEKCCLFSGVEKVAGVPWYEAGARMLVEHQAPDGGWDDDPHGRRVGSRSTDRRGDVLDTAFALLFLLRSSEAYRPITPSPVDTKPPPTVTPSDPPGPAPSRPAGK